MSNHIRNLNTLDQENEHKSLTGLKNQLNSKNNALQQKRPGPTPGNPGAKRLRVPLAGKDQNSGFPALQRSKSSVAQNALQDSAQRTLRPLSASLTRQPTLAKSNSSLGFTHRPLSASLGNQIRNADPHKNNIFPSAEAHRPNDLVPRFSTDLIKKSDRMHLPPLGTNLRDTFSASTHNLHASNVVGRDIYKFPGDPFKRAKDADNRELIERLANDPDSIEHVAQRDVPQPRHVPVGLVPLLDEDLEFIRTGTRNKAYTLVSDISFESTWDEDNIEDEEENAAYGTELEESGLIGLTTQELNDLLDF